MNKIKLITFITLAFCSAINSKEIPNITKADYYDYYVAPEKGRMPERQIDPWATQTVNYPYWIRETWSCECRTQQFMATIVGD